MTTLRGTVNNSRLSLVGIRRALRGAFAVATVATLAGCGDRQPPLAPNVEALAVDVAPSTEMLLVDHYSCVSYNSGVTWYCSYTYTSGWDDDPFQYTSNEPGSFVDAPVDCSDTLALCGSGAGPTGYDAFADPKDKSDCDPVVDPNCEKVIPDSTRAKIRMAINQHLKNFDTMADTALRARCQAMKDKFLAMFDNQPNSEVFIGASDQPLKGDSVRHFGAQNPATGHIHFDPWVLNGLVPASNNGWQVANTALHEAAHALNVPDHSDPIRNSPIRGGSPVYKATELYFSDLNPGPNSCMKP